MITVIRLLSFKDAVDDAVRYKMVVTACYTQIKIKMIHFQKMLRR